MQDDWILSNEWLTNLPERVHKVSQELEVASWKEPPQIPDECVDQLNRLAIELKEMVDMVKELKLSHK